MQKQQPVKSENTIVHYAKRAGAAGKALLVYLGTGSIVTALLAYLVFNMMGC